GLTLRDACGKAAGREGPQHRVELWQPRRRGGRRNLLLGSEEERIGGRTLARRRCGTEILRRGLVHGRQAPELRPRPVVRRCGAEWRLLVVPGVVSRQGEEFVAMPCL